MKCRICGCDTPKGAKLCKDCAAARKRAFAATVTQPLLLAAAGAPSVSQPRFAPRPSKQKSTALARNAAAKTTAVRPEPASTGPGAALKTRPIDRSHASPAISPLVPAPAPQRQSLTPVRTPPRRSMMRWLAILAGAGFVVVLLAIMIVLRRGSTTEGSEETTSRAPATTAAPTKPAATAVTAPAVVDTSPSGVEAALPAVKPAPPKAKRKAAPTENAIQGPAPESKPAIVAEPAPRNVVAPQRVIDTVRTDPLQSLNDALTRCAREDMLNRPGCEQRARSQSCGNWWGQVPQCPIGPATDHGQ